MKYVAFAVIANINMTVTVNTIKKISCTSIHTLTAVFVIKAIDKCTHSNFLNYYTTIMS